jgi:hypothetical protein
VVLHGITTDVAGHKRDDHQDYQQPVKQTRGEIPHQDDPGRAGGVLDRWFRILHSANIESIGVSIDKRLIFCPLCNLQNTDWFYKSFLKKISSFKFQIASTKFQTPVQISINQIPDRFESLKTIIWILFVICELVLGIFSIQELNWI